MQQESMRGYIIEMDNQCGHFRTRGSVYRCSHPEKRDKKLCVKIMKLRNDTIIETETFEKLKFSNHENLVRIEEIFTYQDNQYIVMEFCNCGSLRDLINAKKQSSEIFKGVEILGFVKRFVKGYQELQLNNITHGHIKPENILINDDVYKILVLGISDNQNIISQGTNSSGSKKKISAQTDMHDLGLIIYEMVFLELPKTGNVKIPEKSDIKDENLKNVWNEIIFLIEKLVKCSENDRINFNQLKKRTEEKVYQFWIIPELFFLGRQRHTYLIDQFVVYVDDEVKAQRNVSCFFIKLQLRIYEIKVKCISELISCFPDWQREQDNDDLRLLENADTNFLFVAIMGYRKHMLKNMIAICEAKYENLSLHLQNDKEKLIYKLKIVNSHIDSDEILKNLYQTAKSNMLEAESTFKKTFQVLLDSLQGPTELQELQNQFKIFVKSVEVEQEITDLISYHNYAVAILNKVQKNLIHKKETLLKKNTMTFFLANLIWVLFLEEETPQSSIEKIDKNSWTLCPQLINNRDEAMRIIQQALQMNALINL